MKNLQQQEARALEVCKDLGDDEDLLHDTILGETNLFEEWDKIISSRDAKSLAVNECLMKVQQDIKERIEVVQGDIKKLDRVLMESMGKVGLSKAKLSLATISTRYNAGGLIVKDEALIPDEFFKETTTRTVKKREIREALASGRLVDGVGFGNGNVSLIIKGAM